MFISQFTDPSITKVILLQTRPPCLSHYRHASLILTKLDNGVGVTSPLGLLGAQTVEYTNLTKLDLLLTLIHSHQC